MRRQIRQHVLRKIFDDVIATFIDILVVHSDLDRSDQHSYTNDRDRRLHLLRLDKVCDERHRPGTYPDREREKCKEKVGIDVVNVVIDRHKYAGDEKQARKAENMRALEPRSSIEHREK